MKHGGTFEQESPAHQNTPHRLKKIRKVYSYNIVVV